METLLDIQSLKTYFHTFEGVAKAVDDVSFELGRGEVLGIVGESGCGKSVTAQSVLRLIPDPPGRIAGGRILFEGMDLVRVSMEKMRGIRGKRISMIFQEPMSSLNPVYTIGEQIRRCSFSTKSWGGGRAWSVPSRCSKGCRIPAPEKRIHDYPHQLSGGMRQRAMIAMALSCNPEILIADEPTTALDVTVQAQIIDLILQLRKDFDTAIMMITHDLGVIAEIAGRVVVMYAGKIVEEAGTIPLFECARHPYTRGLLLSVPKLGERLPGERHRLAEIRGMVPGLLDIAARVQFSAPLRPCHGDLRRAGTVPGGGRTPSQGPVLAVRERPGKGGARVRPLLTVEDLKVHFPVKKGLFSRVSGYVHAVDGVSFEVEKGSTLGIVGESGCGKTTAGLGMLRLIRPTSGRVSYEGEVIGDADPARLRKLRKDIQIIFQDPYSSLNPRMTVNQIIADPIKVHGLYPGRQRAERIAFLLEKVGLRPEHGRRYPHEFSGGQRQRIGIARALGTGPRIIVGDEPVSALDVSIQAQVINLLLDLQKEFHLSYVIIAHDLAVVEYICDHIAVMYLGKIVESSSYRDIFIQPKHPYTLALLSAVPVANPRRARERIILKGDVPSPISPPGGCHFHPRCPRRMEVCDRERPELRDVGGGHMVRCFLY